MKLLSPEIYDNHDGCDPFWNMLVETFEDETENDISQYVYDNVEEGLEDLFLDTIVFYVGEELPETEEDI